MSPWLFNVYMDGVVREANVRVKGKVFYGQEPPSGESTVLAAHLHHVLCGGECS